MNFRNTMNDLASNNIIQNISELNEDKSLLKPPFLDFNTMNGPISEPNPDLLSVRTTSYNKQELP